jgi:hypothetical protein
LVRSSYGSIIFSISRGNKSQKCKFSEFNS